jgi:hypothetical protein
VKTVKRKFLVVVLLTAVMLATPLVVCVNAKPATATVVFRSETWGDRDNPNEKNRMGVTGNSSNVLMKQINIIGIPPLTDITPPNQPTTADATAYRGGIRLEITEDSNTYTLLGTVEQLLVTAMAIKAGSGWGLVSNEKATVTITENPVGDAPDGWEGSTLELSIIMIRGNGKILGNKGTGIFENAQFRGTYSLAATQFFVPSLGTVVVYKVQWGTGEMMFT